MILSTHGFVASSIGQKPIVSDADAQAFIDRVYAANASLSLTEANAVNDLVIDLKADSIWTKMKAIYPMVGASAAACSQNLKSSSFTGTFTATGWTFASTGVTPNGTSAYMDTGFNPNSNLSTFSSHMSYYSRTNNSGPYVEMGCTDPTNPSDPRIVMHLNYTGGAYLDLNNDSSGRVYYDMSSLGSAGFQLMSRIANNEAFGQWNGVNKATKTNTITSNLPNSNVWVGGFKNANVGFVYSNRQCAFASIGDGLTDTEASNLYTAVQAFQTTLSRQV